MFTRVSRENLLILPRVRSEIRGWDTFNRLAAPAWVRPSLSMNLRNTVISSARILRLHWERTRNERRTSQTHHRRTHGSTCAEPRTSLPRPAAGCRRHPPTNPYRSRLPRFYSEPRTHRDRPPKAPRRPRGADRGPRRVVR